MKKQNDSAENPAENVRAESRFTAEQLLGSERFRERRDILSVLLEPGGAYTVQEAERKIDSYMKGKVK